MKALVKTDSARVLTAEETAELARLEEVIEKGKQTFIEVGQAMAAVKAATRKRTTKTAR